MNRRMVIGAAVTGTFVVVCALAGWWTVPVGAAVTAAVWLGVRCWHHDVSLLPPVRGGGPDREYARWHCHRCGATWPVALEPASRPRLLHFGYDQDKAQQAAARAETLERERRRLAMARAGLTKKGRESKPVTAVPAGPRPLGAAVAVAAVASGDGSTALKRIPPRGIRRVSGDASAVPLDEGQLARRRTADELPHIRPLRG